MDSTTNDMIKSIIELEKNAESLLVDKHTIVDLDRKRNDARVALREIDKAGNEKTWICMSNTFFRLSTADTKVIIEIDQMETDKKINQLRDGMKLKMNKIAVLEGKPILKGFNLKPLNDEINVMLPNRPYS